MQKFKFPMEYLRVTQGENGTYSHKGSLAMDFGGRDGGSDKLFAPCNMVVKRCRADATGEMYLESTEKVMFADGTVDFARLLCIHDATFNKKVGDVVKQGEHFYDEGGMGGGKPNKFSTHVHIEAGKGKWTKTTQSKNAQGTYVCERQESLYNLFILGEDVQVLDGGGYKWVQENSLTKALESQLKDAQTELVAENDAKVAVQKKLTAAQKNLKAAQEETAKMAESYGKISGQLTAANKSLATERTRADDLAAEVAKQKTILDKIKQLAGG